MKRVKAVSLIAFCLLIVAACTGANQGTDATDGTAQPESVPAQVSSNTGTYFAINEIGLGQNGYIALTNFTDVPASLASLYLCQGVICFELPDVVVAAGETVRIATGDGTGLDGVISTHADMGGLRPTDGEIALVASAIPDDPHSLLLYLQWGSNPHALTQMAVDAGLWTKGGYGPSSENATRLYKDMGTGLWLFDEP